MTGIIAIRNIERKDRVMSNERKFKEILSSDSKKICVIAGPGSGKTTCILVPKARQIVNEPEIDAEKVLLLTFSRLSALNLRGKVESLEKKPRACTVHSYCLSFLMSENDHDIKERIDSILLKFEKEVLISDLKLRLSDKKKGDLRKMLTKFSAGWAIQPHDEVFNETVEERLFKAEVLNWLSEHKATMMEEIVYYAVDLLGKISDSRFINDPQYIFVDEFQDLNKLEQEFISALASNSQLLLVVGDPDQSIYSFKFAHPDGLSKFTQDHQAETHTLPFTGRCAQRIVEVANQLLQQSNPQRKNLLRALPSAEKGETHFVRRKTQREEFEYTLRSIAGRMDLGTKAQNIIVLVPRRKLATEFVSYANNERAEYNALRECDFLFVNKPEFNEEEQRGILLLSLVANPESLLHARAYLGLGDGSHFSKEIQEIKSHYGNLDSAIKDASPSDFSGRKRRICSICKKIEDMKSFIESHKDDESVDQLINELFPEGDTAVSEIREILFSLMESEDTAKELYDKFVDFIRTLPHKDNTIRVMTIMLSKGLEAEHVYMLGCNDGNIPGQNRSTHLTDHEYKEEQRRLLYVGFTRAKSSLTVSWSRNIPYREAKANYTGHLRVRNIDGKKHAVVGLSKFLQDLSGIRWE